MLGINMINLRVFLKVLFLNCYFEVLRVSFLFFWLEMFFNLGDNI